MYNVVHPQVSKCQRCNYNKPEETILTNIRSNGYKYMAVCHNCRKEIYNNDRTAIRDCVVWKRK